MPEIQSNPTADLGTISVIGQGFDPNATAKDRIVTADSIREKASQDASAENLNTKMQLAPMLLAWFGGNAREALKYFNGGPTKVEEAWHPTLGKFLKEYNDNGITGRVFVQKGDKQIPLSEQTIADIDRAGGLISKSDLTAMQAPQWAAASDIVKAQKTGIAKPVLDQYQKSTQAAIAGTAMRDALEQRMSLVLNKKIAPVWDAFSKLPPEERQRIMGMVMSQTGTTGGRTSEIQKGETGSTTIQKNAALNAGAGIGAGPENMAAPGGVAPPNNAIGQKGIPVNANAKIGMSGSGSTSSTAAGRLGVSTGATTGTSESIQSNVQSEINKVLQGAITDPEQFTGLQKIIQLSGLIDSQIQNQRPEDMAPGSVALAPTAVAMNSRKDVVINDINAQRNNALSVAWNAYLANAIHEDQRNSEPTAYNELSKNFMNSKTFKAIERTYDDYIKKAKGEEVTKEVGQWYIDRNNKLKRWNGAELQ